MIASKEDLKYYLKIDKKILGIPQYKKRPNIIGDDLWKFLIILRYHEYYANCHKSRIDRYKLRLLFILHHHYSLKLGFEIPINTFGAGLKLNHAGPIIVNEKASIGKYCDIHVGVNIGQNITPDEVPIIGDNVWIGPGVKIFGKIKIADGIMIGANSVVNRSFLEPNITIAGIPAQKIKDTGNPYMRNFN